MRKALFVFFMMFWAAGITGLAEAGILDDILKKLPAARSVAPSADPDQKTTISGLKEALVISSKMPSKTVSKKTAISAIHS